jgi:hypothetical protein
VLILLLTVFQDADEFVNLYVVLKPRFPTQVNPREADAVLAELSSDVDISFQHLGVVTNIINGTLVARLFQARNTLHFAHFWKGRQYAYNGTIVTILKEIPSPTRLPLPTIHDPLGTQSPVSAFPSTGAVHCVVPAVLPVPTVSNIFHQRVSIVAEKKRKREPSPLQSHTKV